MKPLTLDGLSDDAHNYDATVLQTGDVDHFCSSSHWILPAAQGLMPGRQPWIWRGDSGYLALMRGKHPDGWAYLEPLEAMWKLASPIVGPDPAALAEEFVTVFREREREWDLLMLGGIAPSSPLWVALVAMMSPHYQLRLGNSMRRFCASLEGGLDGFLSRRDRKFRANLRRDQRRLEGTGITFEPTDSPDLDPAALYDRILAIERQSWKGQRHVGIDTGRMRHFYDHMIRRLLPAGALRVHFARHEGRDVAYILGAVLGGTFRGLQFSYLDSYKQYALGNLAQLTMIERLAKEGVVQYDLGSDIRYKRKWGEGGLETATLVAFR